ncbi:MAG: GGDEF domain-containing protein [Lachnospira sp.]|nr:GGDEF domain-containing protein [Lachnospira sp.]
MCFVAKTMEGTFMKSNNSVIGAAFYAMLANTTDMIFVKNEDSVYIAASLPFVKMVGKDEVLDIIGKTDMEIFEDKKLAKRYISDDKKLLEAGKDLLNYMEPITQENGHARYGSTSKYILRNDDKEIIGILGITKDITKEYIAKQSYEQELKYLFEIPENTYAVSYIDVDDWRIINQIRQDIDGTSVQECYSLEELCKAALENISADANVALEFYTNFSSDYLNGIYTSGRRQMVFEYKRRMPDGTTHWVRNKVRFMMDVDTGHLCVMLSAKNIDAEKSEEQELAKAAMTDRMTMLLNRDATMASIGDVLARSANQNHILFMIDVDNFKQLNDTLGHQTGDEFLVLFAAAIKNCFRDDDIVGRVGGDEFFAFLKNASDIDVVNKKAQELLETIQELCAKYNEAKVSGSIGVSMYPNNGKTVDELYAKADSALYKAKREGKNKYILYSDK